MPSVNIFYPAPSVTVKVDPNDPLVPAEVENDKFVSSPTAVDVTVKLVLSIFVTV